MWFLHCKGNASVVYALPRGRVRSGLWTHLSRITKHSLHSCSCLGLGGHEAEKEGTRCSKSTTKLLQEQDRELEAYLWGRGTGPRCARLGWSWESGNKVYFQVTAKSRGNQACYKHTDTPTHCTLNKLVNIPFYLSWMNYSLPLLSLAQSLRFRCVLTDSDQCSLIYCTVIEIIQKRIFSWLTHKHSKFLLSEERDEEPDNIYLPPIMKESQ